MPEIETTKVFWPDKGPGTFQINASDFDPQRHSLATEDRSTAAQQGPQPKTKNARGQKGKRG